MAMDMNVALKIAAGVTGQQAVDQLRTSMDKLEGATSMAGRAFEFLKANIGFLSAVGSVGGLVSLVNSSIDAAAGLADLSIKTGLSVETLSRFSTVAKLSGTAMDDVAGTLKKLSNNAVDAATGNEKMARLFSAVGVSVRDANGNIIKADELLISLAKNIQGIDPEIVNKLMTELGGKNATNLLPFLRELNERLDTTNAKISTEFAKAAKDYQDNMVLLGDSASKLGRELANTLLPSLVRVTDEMLKVKTEGGGFFDRLGAGFKQLTREAAVDYGNIDQAITDTVAKIGRLKELQRSFGADTLTNKINNFVFGDLQDVNRQLKEAEAVLAQLQEIDRKRKGDQGPEVNKNKTDLVTKALSDNNAGADTEANRLARERLALLSRLQDEVTSLTKGEDELIMSKARALGMNDKELQQLSALLAQRTQLKAADRELEEATREANKQRDDAIRKNKELADSGKRVYDETRTPAEKLNIELARLNDLLAQGAIDWDTYSRAIFRAQDEYDNLTKKGKESTDELIRAIEGWGRQSASAIADFVFGAKASFKDLVVSVLKDIATLLIYQNITKPAAAALGSFDFSGLFGGARASGGPVTGGMTYLVGEQGPELFTPSASGSIIPNHALGGSTSVVVNVSVEGGTQVTSDQGAGDLGRLIAASVKSELINQKRPGGLLAA